MSAAPNPALSPAPEEWPEELVNLGREAASARRELEESARADSAQNSALNWLFVDLNSYFASCEQEARPELRGRPVGVVPMMADTTCCIAASYEAKAFGVKTGTIVADAKRMCPEIVLVEARHELYTEFHHRIVEAVESCVPVTAVCSIDEMACRLLGRERPLLAAIDLGLKVKRTICERVGTMLRSSVGLATNRYLAKIASDMEKPDGLVALPLDVLPEALRQLTLRDLPGIGARTEKRLNEKGLHTMSDLLALDCEQTGELWGSVWGQRLWHWLRGEDFEMAELEHQKSISHSHVLAPEMRTPEKAWAVAHKLIHKAAMRLRAQRLWAAQHRPCHWFCGAAQREHAGLALRRARARLAQRDQAPRMPRQSDAHRGSAPLVGLATQGRAVPAPLFRRRAIEQPGPRPAAHACPLRRPRRGAQPHPPARHHGPDQR